LPPEAHQTWCQKVPNMTKHCKLMQIVQTFKCYKHCKHCQPMRHVPSKVALHLQSKFLCKPWIEELGILGISPNLKYCQVSGCLVISRDQAGRANLRRAELHRITMNYTIRTEKQPKNNKKETTGLAPQPRGRKSAQYCPSSRICKLSSRRCFGHFISSSFILSCSELSVTLFLTAST
jgi:hypothetical protein